MNKKEAKKIVKEINSIYWEIDKENPVNTKKIDALKKRREECLKTLNEYEKRKEYLDYKKAMKHALKPFDVVSDKKCESNVGFISEVNYNSANIEFTYSITWITGNNQKSSWFGKEELAYHCNLMGEIAKSMVNSHTGSYKYIDSLLNIKKIDMESFQ